MIINYMYTFLVMFKNCKDFLVIDQYCLIFFSTCGVSDSNVQTDFYHDTSIFQISCIFQAAVDLILKKKVHSIAHF